MNCPDLYYLAYQICAEDGTECPDPGCHPLINGKPGKHAWIMRAIRDARAKAESLCK